MSHPQIFVVYVSPLEQQPICNRRVSVTWDKVPDRHQSAQHRLLTRPPSLPCCRVILVTQLCYLCNHTSFLSISNWLVYVYISLLSSFLCFLRCIPYKQDIIRFCCFFNLVWQSLTVFCSAAINVICKIFGVTTSVLQLISSHSHLSCALSPLLNFLNYPVFNFTNYLLCM